ncbi:MAG: class I SAM-dependent methyltransferase [Clostridia bacterium]|nr:class I SAM-dependent methyltransferase [Clostridia bacterium]
MTNRAEKGDIAVDIIQTFYDNLASQYDKLFLDWQATTQEQAVILNKIFKDNGFDGTAGILDCACGIGTQAIGLAAMGYNVTGSDISEGELAEAKQRAARNGVNIRFEYADFCALSDTFSERFDIVIAMDNALPHMLSREALEAAVRSITGQIAPGGMFVASIRDYDALLKDKPPYSPPYIHKTPKGQKVSFQTWNWEGDNYRLTQYIIEDEENLNISKFECEYRATRREELTELLISNGCGRVEWKFPEETGFYQPIVIARK